MSTETKPLNRVSDKDMEAGISVILDELLTVWTGGWPAMLDIRLRVEVVDGERILSWGYFNPIPCETRSFSSLTALMADAASYDYEAEKAKANRVKAAQLRAEADKLEKEAS